MSFIQEAVLFLQIIVSVFVVSFLLLSILEAVIDYYSKKLEKEDGNIFDNM